MLYPEITPYNEGFLKVSSIHTLYYEESGNPDGLPILFLHGGPGSGTDPNHRRYFNPDYYRIILFDQRGCGKSTPPSCIEENTTFDLCEDMEKIRVHLKINTWILFGGSWGSLLALVYGIKFPNRVSALILRGIFLCTHHDLNWFFYDGAPNIFPDTYQELIEPLHNKKNIIKEYYSLLNSKDDQVALNASKRWSAYEARALKLKFDQEFLKRISDPKKSLSIAKIETHYFIHQAFLPSESWLFENLHILKNIPMHIVHGRYDMVCPIKNAFILKEYCPHAILEIIEDAGHAGSEPGIQRALIHITNSYTKP